MGEIGDIDADREAADRDQAVEQADAAVRHNATEHAIFQIGHQVGDVGLGLQADQIVGRQRPRQLLMLGDGHEGLPGRKRNMQEIPDRVLGPEPAQLGSERQEVVVVHPNQVVGPQQGSQLLRQAPIDIDIALEKAGLELGKIEPIVKNRPQHRVAVAQVIGLMIGLRQRHGGDPPFALDRCRGVLRRNLAVPAEPEGWPRAHDISQRDRHAAGLGGLADVGDPVRHQDNAAHTRLIRFLHQHASLRDPRRGQRTAAAKVPGLFAN
jgi:hypothetical protein